MTATATRVVVLTASLGTALGVAVDAQRTFRAGIDLVTLVATVTDRDGRFISDLTKDDFQVYEDGVQQPVTLFMGGRMPVSVGLLVDTSGSMRGARIRDAREALDQFLSVLPDPEDEASLTAFNHRATLLATWRQPPTALRPLLGGLDPDGGTALYDAIFVTLSTLESAANIKKALLVISDGADTASDHSVLDLRARLRRSDALVYAIGIDAPHARRADDHVNPQTLRDVTDETGGRTEIVRDSADLAAATSRIADELSHQYVLGYVPPHPADDRFHTLRVRVVERDALVRSRRGYVARLSGSIVLPPSVRPEEGSGLMAQGSGRLKAQVPADLPSSQSRVPNSVPVAAIIPTRRR